MAYEKPVPGKLLVEVRSIPNYEAAKKQIQRRTKAAGTNYEPSTDDIAAFFKDEFGSMEFLPFAYQQPICMCLIHDKLPGDKPNPLVGADVPKSKWTMECMVGSDDLMIRRFWTVFLSLKQNYNAYPLLISSDRKKGSIPLIINRSFAIARQQILINASNGVLPKPPVPEEAPEPYACIYAGMKEILDKSDKWEKYRPNYTNQYSTYTPDIAADISSIGTADRFTAKRCEELVRESKYKQLARETATSAMESWRNYAVMQYLSAGSDMVLDCTVDKGYLSNNVTFSMLPLKTNPVTLLPEPLPAPRLKTKSKKDDSMGGASDER